MKNGRKRFSASEALQMINNMANNMSDDDDEFDLQSSNDDWEDKIHNYDSHEDETNGETSEWCSSS